MSDKKSILPIVISVVLHLALIGILVWKFIWKPNIPEHKYVDAPIQARIAQAPKKTLPQPQADEEKREQERLEKQQQEKERLEKLKREKELAEKKAQEQAEAEKAAEAKAELERKKKIALEKKLEEEKKKKEEAEEKRLAEEKRKKEEAERKRKEEAEEKRLAEEKRKKEEAERKRKEEAEEKRLAEEKRKKEEAERRKKREEAERKRQEEFERLQKELAAEDDELFDAMEGDVKKAQALTERDKFLAMIDAKIQQNWYKPNNPGICKIQIKTGPGGVVLDAQIVNGTDDATCDTGLAAVYRSEPLPYPENPDVIEELRVIGITFEPKTKD